MIQSIWEFMVRHEAWITYLVLAMCIAVTLGLLA